MTRRAMAGLVVCAVLTATVTAGIMPRNTIANTLTVPGGVHLPPPKLTPGNCTQTHGTKDTAPPAREVAGRPATAHGLHPDADLLGRQDAVRDLCLHHCRAR